MEASQKLDWFKGFMDHLRDLIKGPPYWATFFVSAILLLVSSFRPICFRASLAIFLYSIFGIIWRHAVKDIRGILKEAYPSNYTKANLVLTSAYHVLNLVVVFALVYVVAHYCI